MTVNINAANITSIRLADQANAPTGVANNFINLYADTNGDIATVKGGGGGIKITTSPATGNYTLTVDGTGTAARLNASQTFTGTNTFNQNLVLANGIGIDFSATSGTGTSELFDDYEEGDILSSSLTLEYQTPGTSSFTYANRSGIYVKIGRTVFFTIDIRLSGFTKGTASGDLSIVGLPFTARTTSGFTEQPSVAVLYNWTFTSAIAPIAFVLGATTKIQINKMVSNAVFAVIDDPGASSMLFVTGYYFV